MKKTLSILLLGLCAISTIACKHSAKDPDLNEITPTTAAISNDDIVKETVKDRHGDEMEVITNNTKNSIMVRLDGQSYEFHKNAEGNDYSTEDNKYQFSETKYEVTLLKKGADMVLFHGKRDQAATKLASQ